MASPIARAPQHHGGGRPRPNDGPRQRPVRLCDLSTDDRAVHHFEKLLTLPRGAFSGITCGDHTNDGIFYFMDAKTERASPPTSFARKGADGLWYVAVVWGNGRNERLGPYKTEAAAQDPQLAAWHEGRKLFLKPPQ